MAIQNKKRKQSSSDHDTSASSDEISNIESVLFNEMTLVNSHLVSLAEKVKLVDHRYFSHNSAMIDEFIGTVHEFLRQVDIHRKKLSYDQLSSDTLFNIYQFLDTPTLVSCQLVSKLWKETLNGIEMGVTLRYASTHINSLVNSSMSKNVTSLTLGYAGPDVFQTLSGTKNLNNLKTLNLSSNDMGIASVKHLQNCSMHNLTELDLRLVRKFKEREAKMLFNSSFMSSVKKLNLSGINASKKFCEFFSSSKYLNQLTHLNFNGIFSSGIDLILKDKINLEHLEVEHCNISSTNQLTNGNYSNITFLNISNCHISNSEFIDLLISPNLPKLTTLKARSINQEYMPFAVVDNSVVQLPPNSQSSITDLDLEGSNIIPFSNFTYHCPKLKKLNIFIHNFVNEDFRKAYVNSLSAPALSNLEYLKVCCNSILLDIIFTSPFYSNLKEIDCEFSECAKELDLDLISNCNNLVNLTTFKALRLRVTSDCLQVFKTNPTFSNLKTLKFAED